ncbi:MAG TPA: hypothetical protein GX703_04680 [Erysipelothrix sp.]|jgi:hypothetical protein|nr:hypothetical protein [Erysipelothrix sp.]
MKYTIKEIAELTDQPYNKTRVRRAAERLGIKHEKDGNRFIYKESDKDKIIAYFNDEITELKNETRNETESEQIISLLKQTIADLKQDKLNQEKQINELTKLLDEQ